MTERRTRTRRRILKGATIRFDQSAVITCLIRSISGRGACLEVESPLGIPKAFDLVLDSDRSVHRCHIAWQTRRHIGVSFEG